MWRSGSESNVNAMANDASREALIVEVELPSSQMVLMQSILQGEEGLATVRCLDPAKRKQQFWTTCAQRDELYAWLDSLPPSIGIKVTGEWIWQETLESANEQ